jgi:hypothetical protein
MKKDGAKHLKIREETRLRAVSWHARMDALLVFGPQMHKLVNSSSISCTLIPYNTLGS